MRGKDHYRLEMAKRGKATPVAAKERATELRERFLERLSLVRQERSLREFARVVGIPHSTIHSWSRDEQSQPNLLHLQAIADHAELPGVPRGQLSLDWLCGLSDELSRNTRVEAEQLPARLAAHVAREAIDRAGPARDPAFREHLRRKIRSRGQAMTQLLVDMATERVRANEANYRGRLDPEKSAIREALVAAEGINAGQFETIMRALYAPPPLPSDGTFITWPAVNTARILASATEKPRPRKRARVRRSS